MPATSNRTRFSWVREVTPGTMPASPAFQIVRVTNNALTAKALTEISEEVRSDRMTADVAIVGKDVGGQIDMEFSAGTTNLALEEAMCSAITKSDETVGITSVAAGTGVYTFPSGPTYIAGNYLKITGCTNAANNGFFRVTSATGTTVTTDNVSSVVEASPPATSRIKEVGFKAAANGDINASTSGGNHLTSALNPATFGLVPGRWFRCLNFATAALNSWYRCGAITGAGPYTIALDFVPTGFATDTAAAAKVVLVFSDYVRNGTTRLTHAGESALLDAAGGAIYGYRLGDQTNQLTIDMSNRKIIKLTATMLGMDTIPPSITQVSSPTYAAAGTSPVVNTATGLQRIAEGLTQLNGGSQNLPLGCKIMINNNLRAQPAAGQIALAGAGFGDQEISGTLDVYLDTPTMIAKLWASTESAFDTRFVDALGNGCVFDAPRIRFLDGDPTAGAKNQDITPSMAWRALAYTPASGAQYALHCELFEAVS